MAETIYTQLNSPSEKAAQLYAKSESENLTICAAGLVRTEPVGCSLLPQSLSFLESVSMIYKIHGFGDYPPPPEKNTRFENWH